MYVIVAPSKTTALLNHISNQRPTAHDLLKHKFIRMAKKTSYLTELIERHERWRAEGGERTEEEERHHAEDLYVRLYTLNCAAHS